MELEPPNLTEEEFDAAVAALGTPPAPDFDPTAPGAWDGLDDEEAPPDEDPAPPAAPTGEISREMPPAAPAAPAPEPEKFSGKSDGHILAALVRLGDNLGVAVNVDSLDRAALLAQYTELERVQGHPPADRPAVAAAKGYLPAAAPAAQQPTPGVQAQPSPAAQTGPDLAQYDLLTRLAYPVAIEAFEERVNELGWARDADTWAAVLEETKASMRTTPEYLEARQDEKLAPLLAQQQEFEAQQTFTGLVEDVRLVIAEEQIAGLDGDGAMAFLTAMPAAQQAQLGREWRAACQRDPAGARVMLTTQLKALAFDRIAAGKAAPPGATPRVAAAHASGAAGRRAATETPAAGPNPSREAYLQHYMQVTGSSRADALAILRTR